MACLFQAENGINDQLYSTRHCLVIRFVVNFTIFLLSSLRYILLATDINYKYNLVLCYNNLTYWWSYFHLLRCRLQFCLPFKSGYSGYGSVPGIFFDLPGKIREIRIFQDFPKKLNFF